MSPKPPELALANVLPGGSALGSVRARPARPRGAPPFYLYFTLYPGGVASPLASEYFWLESFEGEDLISDHFHYELEFRAQTLGASGGAPGTPQALVGRAASVAVVRPHENWDVKAHEQALVRGGARAPAAACSFSGIIASFGFTAPGVYFATLRPALFKLTLTNNYRVLHGSVKEVIAEVLALHGIAPRPEHPSPGEPAAYYAFRADALATDRLQPWFQAGETDYEFVQRLMAKANLYYYYEFGPNSHTVVFTNRAPRQRLRPRVAPHYTFTDAEPLGLERDDVIRDYRFEQRLTATGIESVFVRQVEDWAVACAEVAPQLHWRAARGLDGTNTPGALPFHLLKNFPYGADAGEVERFARQQAAMLAATSSTLSGTATSPDFRAGLCFELKQGQHGGPEHVEPFLDGRWFALTRVQHRASLDGTYTNSFEAVDLGLEEDGLHALLTPFNPQGTQPNAVLGTVVPEGPGSDDYLPRSAFAPRPGALEFRGAEAERERPPGVLVQLSAPGEAAKEPVWVALPKHMTTVPQAGAVVSVARAQNESELPELSEVIDSHGSMTVKTGHWDANTNVGNNFSTNYGDSRSVRYGTTSPGAAELELAVGFVTNPEATLGSDGSKVVAEDGVTGAAARATSPNAAPALAPAPAAGTLAASSASGAPAPSRTALVSPSPSALGVAVPAADPTASGALPFSDVSYSQGSSCNYTTSNDGPDGLLSCSISRGSDFSSRIGAASKSYSILGSQAARAAATFEVDALSDVVQGSQNWVLGTSKSVSVNQGDVISTNRVTGGRQLSATSIGGAPLPALPSACVMGSATIVLGDSVDDSTHLGNVTSTNTVDGISKSTSTIVTEISSRTVGASTSEAVVGTETSHEQVNSRTSTSEVGSDVSQRTTGLSLASSVVGADLSHRLGVLSLSSTTIATELSDRATALSVSSSDVAADISSHTSAVSLSTSDVAAEISSRSGGVSVSVTMTGAESSTRMVGASSSTALVGAEESVQLTGVVSSTALRGSETNISVTGSSSTIAVTGSKTNISVTGSETSLGVVGASVEANIGPGYITAKTGGLFLDMLEIKIVL